MQTYQPTSEARLSYRAPLSALLLYALVSIALAAYLIYSRSSEITRVIVFVLILLTGLTSRLATYLSKADVYDDGFTLTLWRFPFGPQRYAFHWADIASIVYARPGARNSRLFLWNRLKFTLVLTDGKTIRVRQRLGGQRYVANHGAFGTVVGKAVANAQWADARKRLLQQGVLAFGEVNEGKRQAQRQVINERFATTLNVPAMALKDASKLAFEVPWVALSEDRAAVRIASNDHVKLLDNSDELEVTISLKASDGLPKHFIVNASSLDRPAKYSIHQVRNPYLAAQLLATDFSPEM